MRRPLAIVLAAWLSHGAGASAAGPRSRPAGTYRLRGTARVEAGPILSRVVEGRADAVLRPAGPPGAVRVRLAAQGHACELGGTASQDGALVLEAGQRCTFDLDDPGARGRVEARLRSGRGTLRGRTLALELSFELSGALSLQTARQVEVLGRTVDLPAAWTPELPVRGEATAVAEGERDDSRAAER